MAAGSEWPQRAAQLASHSNARKGSVPLERLVVALHEHTRAHLEASPVCVKSVHHPGAIAQYRGDTPKGTRLPRRNPSNATVPEMKPPFRKPPVVARSTPFARDLLPIAKLPTHVPGHSALRPGQGYKSSTSRRVQSSRRTCKCHQRATGPPPDTRNTRIAQTPIHGCPWLVTLRHSGCICRD